MQKVNGCVLYHMLTFIFKPNQLDPSLLAGYAGELAELEIVVGKKKKHVVVTPRKIKKIVV